MTEKQQALADEVSDVMAEGKTADAAEDARFGPGKRDDERPPNWRTVLGAPKP